MTPKPVLYAQITIAKQFNFVVCSWITQVLQQWHAQEIDNDEASQTLDLCRCSRGCYKWQEGIKISVGVDAGSSVYCTHLQISSASLSSGTHNKISERVSKAEGTINQTWSMTSSGLGMHHISRLESQNTK